MAFSILTTRETKFFHAVLVNSLNLLNKPFQLFLQSIYFFIRVRINTSKQSTYFLSTFKTSESLNFYHHYSWNISLINSLNVLKYYLQMQSCMPLNLGSNLTCLLVFLLFLFRDYMNQLCLRLETIHRVKSGDPLLSSGCDEIIFAREFAQSGRELLKSFLRVEFIKRWMRLCSL